MSMEMNPATLWEAISDAVPEREAVLHKGRRITWRQFDDRSARLAGALVAAGLGRGSKVGQLLFNCPEFVESYFAALKIRAVPFNINTRYTADEVAYLLDNADAEALVFHSSLAGVVAPAVARSPGLKIVIEVDDGTTGAVPEALAYEAVLAAATPAERITRSADDITMIYTGGTTGMPKGVVTRVGPPLDNLIRSVPAMVGQTAVPLDDVPALAQRLGESGDVLISHPACPLIHNTATTMGMSPPLAMGGTIVLAEGHHFDPVELWDLAAAERVMSITIVGDAFARPMLAELDANPGRDLSCVRSIGSAGTMFSTEVKAGLLAHLPQAMILDYIGASEGSIGLSVSTSGSLATTGQFRPNRGVIVVDENFQRVQAEPGNVGLVAVPGGGDGYFKDAAKSATTFRMIDGERYTIPGDFVRYEDERTVTLLGRGSACINTAGEKVYPEEVEEVIKSVAGVEDCLVFGVDDDRFGQRVVAVVSHENGASPSEDAIIRSAREHLAGYKVPRTIRTVDVVPRTQVGKPDYATARSLFERADRQER